MQSMEKQSQFSFKTSGCLIAPSLLFYQLFRLVTTKIAKQKLDVMVEEVAARMSDFITRNRNKIVELYSAIGVLAEYQAEVKYFHAQQHRFSFLNF